MACRYLTKEKHKGRALDPVAHLHLTNGAFVWWVNWMGDASPTGLRRSYGLMANYHYHLSDMDRYSTTYTMDGRVTISENIETSRVVFFYQTSKHTYAYAHAGISFCTVLCRYVS